MLDIQITKISKEKVQQKMAPYRKYFSAILLLGGFIADTFTLNRIDQVFDNLVLIIHLLIVAVVLILLQARSRPGLLRLTQARIRSILLGLLMFSYGGLFSGFTIFYAKSAGLFSGWAFVLLLLFVMLSAEYYQKVYERLLARVGAWILALHLYLIFAVPVVLGQMGPRVFIISTIITVIVSIGFIFALRQASGDRFMPDLARLKGVASFVVGLTAVLYFTNLIPPVPLSLQYKSTYYEVSRQGNGYVATYEPVAWNKVFGSKPRILSRPTGQPVYVFSSVFAPVNLHTNIVHQWQRKDSGVWVTTDEIVIPITGGREDGFRGFSFKQNHQPGSWRVRIMTESGQTIGSIRFKIEHSSTPVNLKQENL